MTHIITKPWRGVRKGEVYPTTFMPGDPIDGELAVIAAEAGAAWPAESSPPAATAGAVAAAVAAAPVAPTAVRAKMKVKYNYEENGENVTLAKGSIVEGPLAARLIAEGAAVAAPAAPVLTTEA